MSKLTLIADIHIKLGQKHVPKIWQESRIIYLAETLVEETASDTLVIAGDLLDSAKPSLEELGLMYRFLSILCVRFRRIYLIPGNHEMETKTRDCYQHIGSILEDLGVSVIREFCTINGVDYIPYNILHSDSWVLEETGSKIAITHVRGEIPPHVSPEVDLSKFSKYDKVFAGDLHSYLNCQKNLFYPGSPITTSFHRSEVQGANGYFIIEESTGEHEWVELKLPQLLRKTVSSQKDMVATKFHHTIYELEGSIEELAAVNNSDLLDKKVTLNVSTPATLNLTGNIEEELIEYLEGVKGIKDVSPYLSLFKEIITYDNN